MSKEAEDLYKLLGISAEAGEKELTRAYRIKALKYHPDKNRDNPEAVQLFHSIKAAYDLLTDTKKRAEYDEQRRAQLAKRQRQDALSGHRKKMKSQLEEDEHKAQQARGAERMRAQNMRDEAARFREESLREEWRRDKSMREHIQQTQQMEADGARAKEERKRQAAATMEDVDELDRSVRIRWDSGEGAVDRGLIAKVFASFGEIEEVVLAPVSEHGRKRNIANAQQSALVVFKSIASAHALMNVQHESPRLQRFSRFWAAGKEPDAVRNIVGMAQGSGRSAVPSKERSKAQQHEETSSQNGRPDISRLDPRNIPGIDLDFAGFEALTLMRMRQFQQQKAASSE
ncbi:hypothetical protein GGI25_006060 [Coemansia spiralis]|uniref:J domain-containing protein n=2 Tax=Coemansia TaxID=4863 RepID=A0A9W8G2T5_9FUNG|nr:hypothetical protein EDC05_005779 [Coemansia umbellata]KAJ2619353.1 hypothetical protein GGI26_005899 [Coemansia sp. RSA 1358]KAJ2669720.1 hypothetical protein GGI25_006060 [Coemansia spiralis]